MLAATLVSFSVVFLAELGDRSQFIAMTYALRYRWWVVLTGVGIAAGIAHGASVAVGHFLGLTLPARPMAFAAAVAFLAFAVLTWRERSNTGEDVRPVREPRFALLAVVSSFLLAELGDKTTLATIALASDNNWAGVWIGTTTAMVVGDGLAIAAGLLLHRRLPQRLLHVVASLLFLLCGLWMLFDGALGWRPMAIGAIAATTLTTAAVAAAGWTRRPTPQPAILESSRGAS
ncbi:TMEM165/GDT1 family protein [Mycobacterium sp.]|uniref:TMEM165/GDT1 family protein n=1 Tax=Mycobacterium sp. TaxID=1785 RepID=UPI00127ABC0D|nr:TMEM165/GDT1 family protein [Mycobacterium sp.]KAA8969810.1 MAG: TMEM165/GDT1 family protein [Mycobacterium sp.]